MNRFMTAVCAKQFLVTAEVMPPKGSDPTRMVNMSLALKDWVHAVNVTDGSRAVLRASSLASAAALKQAGVEPICQVTCRDRNSMALQADLMGAHMLGVHTILALTGDPLKAGDHPHARSVFELESVRLLKLISALNQGMDSNGKTLPDGRTRLFAGAAIDPQLKSWSGLRRRFEHKVEAGAQFFQSQLVCDFERLAKFVDQVASQADKPVLAGIFLLKSAKNARFINKYVPGVQISQEIIDRLERADDPLYEGMAIAAEQVKMAQQLCQGVHMMAIKQEHVIPQILEMAGVQPITSSPPEIAGTNHDYDLMTHSTRG